MYSLRRGLGKEPEHGLPGISLGQFLFSFAKRQLFVKTRHHLADAGFGQSLAVRILFLQPLQPVGKPSEFMLRLLVFTLIGDHNRTFIFCFSSS